MSHPKCGRPACRRRFDKKRPDHRYCSKRCNDMHQREKRCAKTRMGAIKQRPKKHYGPLVPDAGAHLCQCGNELQAGSNPITGVSMESCSACGYEGPIAQRGVRQYDQRTALLEAMQEHIKTAKAPAKPKARSGAHGDGLRQATHKKSPSLAHWGKAQHSDFHVIGRTLKDRMDAA